MDIHCPYCQFRISIQGVRAGRFSPKCPSCREAFALTIPDGEGAVPRVKAIAKPATPPVEAGVTMPPPAMTNATLPPSPAVPPPPPQTTAAETLAPSPASVRPPAATDSSSAASVVPRTDATDSSRPALDSTDDLPTSLGGYAITRKLGQGGMGAVYLARQVSLDRNVAVKVLSPELSQDAGFVARFTREAFAAAQLVHHHVVQVYDIGEDKGRHFYSMEYVEGENLASLVARNGRFDPETAIAYTLQAARGLKFAHDRGLIHRDVKPDNLMLNAEGVIKVADLGLVKKGGVADVPAPGDSKLAQAQSADKTGFHMSMGTPAYMAPEQARDAATVDRRADIYSLGCTLYDLLTGHPPFAGKTAFEVITKHQSEPITPPDVVSRRVPKEVSALLMKMVAKRVEDRYADMGAVVMAMEDFLGTSSSGPFTPKEEHAAAVETAAKRFRDLPLAVAARYTPLAFFGMCALLAIVAAMFWDTLGSRVIWAGTFIGLGVLTFAAYIVVAGITRRDVVLGRLRPLVYGARLGDWARTAMVIAVALLLLYAFGLLGAWAVVAIVAIGCASAFHFGLQWPRDRQRQAEVQGTIELARSMRLRGLDEDTLRQFICRYSGRHWEEFYEEMFGYDAMLEARRRWGLSLRGKPRPKYAIWRDALIAWANARATARKAERERRILQRAEEAKLKAEGLDLLTARKAAQKEATALVRRAEVDRQKTEAVRVAEARQAITALPTPMAPATPAAASTLAPIHTIPAYSPPVVVRTLADDEPVERDHESAFTRRGGILAMLFGPTPRFFISLVLLAAFVLWFRQNNPQFPQNFGEQIKEVGDATISDLQAGRDVVLKTDSPKSTRAAPRGTDLKFTGVPEVVRHRLSGYGVGLAGVLLMLSCIRRSWKTGLLTLAGAALIVCGDALVPALAGTRSTLVAIAGVALAILGFAFGRER